MKLNSINSFLVIALFFSSFVLGQKKNEIATQVVYKLHNDNKSSKFKTDNLEFELLFDAHNSLYRIVDKMIDESDKNYKITSIIHGGNLIYYSNNATKETLFNVSLNDVKYNVKQKINQYVWNITDETKIINGFRCFKATTSFEKVDKVRNSVIKQNSEVWFTSEIPTSFGPRGLNGLPGLILEGTLDGRTHFYAAKIVNNYKMKDKITKPFSDKELDEKEFDEIIFENYKKIKDSQASAKK